MTMENVCLYNKYGYCKYRNTCHKLHYEETCKAESCETVHCPMRHPRPCKYFNIYKRCKFGSFCLFTHENERLSSVICNDKVMKEKCASLEDRVKTLEDEIKISDAKHVIAENKIKVLENRLESVFESTKVVIEMAVKKVTEDLVSMIFKQQEAIEENQRKSFDTLNKNLSEIIAQSHSLQANRSSQPLSAQPNQQPSSYQGTPSPQTRFQCDLCGKSFGSNRALSNHTRRDHEPKS